MHISFYRKNIKDDIEDVYRDDNGYGDNPFCNMYLAMDVSYIDSAAGCQSR